MFVYGMPLRAQIETTPEDTTAKKEEVTAKGVGVVGGIVAGAELVLVTESIIRVKPLWPYLVFPIVGAAGGGFGGYKLEKNSRGGAIALLITAMVGVIPTAIAVSASRSFDPEDVGARMGTDALQPTSLPPPDYSNGVNANMGTDESTVEVEAKPDALPESREGPPAPPKPAEAAPDAASIPAEVIPSSPDGEESQADDGTQEESSLKPESSSAHVAQRERIAHLSSGALFHLNRELRFGMGIPAVDVFPLQLPEAGTHLPGVEVQIPLIALDLP